MKAINVVIHKKAVKYLKKYTASLQNEPTYENQLKALENHFAYSTDHTYQEISHVVHSKKLGSALQEEKLDILGKQRKLLQAHRDEERKKKP
mmetsp:Transcript_40599/g.39191  ORF Transcript_40599/g.39191 Transcript_40599/m.39191 type:complete len:92 (+) Transcript_40599:512-787(+)